MLACLQLNNLSELKFEEACIARLLVYCCIDISRLQPDPKQRGLFGEHIPLIHTKYTNGTTSGTYLPASNGREAASCVEERAKKSSTHPTSFPPSHTQGEHHESTASNARPITSTTPRDKQKPAP